MSDHTEDSIRSLNAAIIEEFWANGGKEASRAASGRNGCLNQPIRDARRKLASLALRMISFRIGDDEAMRTKQWAEALGIDRSELLRDALQRHLARLAAENDIQAWTERPLDSSESTLAEIAEWGPAQDWSDWTDATR